MNSKYYEKEDKEVINENQAQNPPSKAKGCLATLAVFFVMFGLPFIFIQSGIDYDSPITKILVILLFGAVNLAMWRHRKKLGFSKKKYFEFSEMEASEIRDDKELCNNCSAVLNGGKFCTECGAKVGVS